MNHYFRARDDEAWNAVLTGWTPPVKMNDDGTSIIKPSETWTTEEKRLAKSNTRVLHTIFLGVTDNQLKFIMRFESARDAWIILQNKHEGAPGSAVRRSNLQKIRTGFESLRMSDNETIPEFHTKLFHIAYDASDLGEKFSEAELVRKTLRSLPERFDMKLTAIKEFRDVDAMTLDELMESLQIFEIDTEIGQMQRDRQDRSVAVNFNDTVKKATGDSHTCSEEVDALTKNFKREKYSNARRQTARNKNKGVVIGDEQRDKKKGIRCYECGGYGHVRAVCANTLKKKKMSVNRTWSDEDSDDDENVGNLVALGGRCYNIL